VSSLTPAKRGLHYRKLVSWRGHNPRTGLIGHDPQNGARTAEQDRDFGCDNSRDVDLEEVSVHDAPGIDERLTWSWRDVHSDVRGVESRKIN
jgi:hypothetical protein